MINAVIFDMDGLLIDSEPFWQDSEILIFERVGLKLTREMCMRTMGLRVDEVVEYWYQKQPWERVEKREVEEAIIDAVIEMVRSKGEPKEGVHSALSFIKGMGIRTAIASSSSLRAIRAVLEGLQLEDQFEVVHSAEEEEYGKPHPAVYMTAARKLGVNPTECLAVEDSLNGVIAAKAARMKCIAVPEAVQRTDPRFSLADSVLDSLAEINVELWQALYAQTGQQDFSHCATSQ